MKFVKASQWSAPLLALVLLMGCGENAILELEVVLPPGNGSARVDIISGTSTPTGFPDADSVVPLNLGAEETSADISVVATPDQYEQDLFVRVRFCDDAPCSSVSGASRYRIERPFYPLERTAFTLRIDALPSGESDEMAIGRCRVAGCRSGLTNNYCRRDGSHFCEELP